MLNSPRIYSEKGFSFVMYFNEGNEPPHVHAVKGKCEAKFWLSPVRLQVSHKCKRAEIAAAEKVIKDNIEFFMEQWNVVKSKI